LLSWPGAGSQPTIWETLWYSIEGLTVNFPLPHKGSLRANPLSRRRPGDEIENRLLKLIECGEETRRSGEGGETHTTNY